MLAEQRLTFAHQTGNLTRIQFYFHLRNFFWKKKETSMEVKKYGNNYKITQ